MEREKIYSISEAARICGVTVKQIRNWEENHYIPKLERVLCGERNYRQFTQEDLKVIAKIKKYLDEGYELRTAAGKAAEKISQSEGKTKMANKNKKCPMFKEDCLTTDCSLFNEKFKRCEIGLLTYNLYRFSESMNYLSKLMNGNEDSKENPFKDFLKV